MTLNELVTTGAGLFATAQMLLAFAVSVWVGVGLTMRAFPDDRWARRDRRIIELLNANNREVERRREAERERDEARRRVRVFIRLTKSHYDRWRLAESDLRASRNAVSRIWTILGNPTYEQLNGRTIYDLVEEAVSKAKRAEQSETA